MLSRLADALFWFGRYLERAEHTARLLDVNYHAIVEAPLASAGRGIVAEQWAPLLRVTDSEPAFRQRFDRADAASVVAWLTTHPDNPASIRACLTFARENARALRDRISTETWEAVNRAYHALAATVDAAPEEDALHEYCVSVREASHLVTGIIDATLPRDLGWYVLAAGRSLERADNVVRTLMVRHRRAEDGPVAAGLEAHRAMALLKSMSAYEAYRKRHRTPPDPERIAAYLLLDPAFPRSLRASLEALHADVRRIVALNPAAPREVERQVGWLTARVAYCPHVGRIVEDGDPSLDELLDALSEISDTMARTYFGVANGGGVDDDASEPAGVD